MPKLDGLNFDTPNNACLSLRLLAEWIRAGDVTVIEPKLVVCPGNAFVSLDLKEGGHGRV